MEDSLDNVRLFSGKSCVLFLILRSIARHGGSPFTFFALGLVCGSHYTSGNRRPLRRRRSYTDRVSLDLA